MQKKKAMCLLTYKPLLFLLFCATLFVPEYTYASTLKNQTAIDEFYLSRDGEPLWLKKNLKINKSGKELLDVLRQAWQNGLNPNFYHVDKISQILEKKRRIGKDDTMKVELLLTDGYISYVRDLSGMRVNARDIGLNPKHWQQRISANEALAIMPSNNIGEFLHKIEPQTKTYQRLKSELITLLEDENFLLSEDIQEKLVFKSLVRPNRGYSDIPKLRARFMLDEVAQQDIYRYDDALVSAIMRFQAEKGLKPDGIIGKQTLRALNQTNIDKIKQIIVNMERLRWVSDVKPERFVVVNIPSATLWAIDNGKVRFEMPVIVGREERPTLSFVTNIHGVRFNPTWTIPPTIKLEDILPSLQENPNYLSDKGIELYDGYGKDAPTLDSLAIDWETMGEAELHSLRMVQVPGKHNPLGDIRILMPNEHNIYLHDTNDKELFYRTDRAKSSGCIRMKYPEKLALFALEKRKNWSKDNMLEVLEENKTRDIYTPEKIAIYLLYYTIWLGDKSRIIYGFDIYNRDNALLQLLEKLDGFYVIGDNDTRMVQLVD